MLAKIANDDVRSLFERGALEFFASKLAPTPALFVARASACNSHIFRRKTSNPGAHLVQSQPL
ncbi:hypothetical protein [Pseudomonas sp. MIACH]|uniref:hypothetical protein n=1 Tax=Pseudomonas sp. MIACH TaxID=1078355 RepID=UPI000AF4FA73|nr:hypothetical protein [Pseudomonas sp. MIACH]